MTTYRLFPSTSGPSSPTSYAGSLLAGVMFKVTQGGMFFNGYYHWVPTGGDTVARKFALWNVTSSGGAATLLSAATVTSGTLTAGTWNSVPLTTSIPLAAGAQYCACTGWTAVNGFPDSDTSGAGTGAGDSYGTGGHTAGITSGPLTAYSDVAGNGGTNPPVYGGQGVFATSGTDPTVAMPFANSNSGNFWMDVQVQDTTPSAYAGTYRLWPNKFDTNPGTGPDAAFNYDVATEFALSQACTLNRIWYYSPSGTAQLATLANIWSITGTGLTGALAAQVTSPTWSGAAASGWVSCTVPGNVTLQAGKYKVSVYNGAATPDGWGAKDIGTDYWRNGDGKNGITWGPLSAPNLSNASLAYNYNGSNPGSTPPYTDGTTHASQPSFTQGPPDSYPYLNAPISTPTAGSTQNYWVDVEVTPAPGLAVPAPQLAVTRTEVIGGGRGGPNRVIRM